MPGKGKKVKHGELDKKISKAEVDDGAHNFGRLVEIRGNVVSLAVSDQLATQLAQAMTETPPDDAAHDSAISSGYTFFGQFIDHDLTLDNASILGSTVDPTSIDDIRTPFFDLDCVYGDGPASSPDIYDGNTGRVRIDHHDGAARSRCCSPPWASTA